MLAKIWYLWSLLLWRFFFSPSRLLRLLSSPPPPPFLDFPSTTSCLVTFSQRHLIESAGKPNALRAAAGKSKCWQSWKDVRERRKGVEDGREEDRWREELEDVREIKRSQSRALGWRVFLNPAEKKSLFWMEQKWNKNGKSWWEKHAGREYKNVYLWALVITVTVKQKSRHVTELRCRHRGIVRCCIEQLLFQCLILMLTPVIVTGCLNRHEIRVRLAHANGKKKVLWSMWDTWTSWMIDRLGARSNKSEHLEN